jgi:hypothetical protein
VWVFGGAGALTWMIHVGVARWQAASSQRPIAESLPGCERSVNSSRAVTVR